MSFPKNVWIWVLAFALNALYFVVPLPLTWPFWVSLAHWGIGALVTVCLIGKLLLDTLFYDRYRP